MKFFLTSVFIFAFSACFAQLPEFSGLSSRKIDRIFSLQSLQRPDGFLYFAQMENNTSMLYKVGFDGIILDSGVMQQGDYRFTGLLIDDGDNIVFTGEAYKPFLDYHQFFTERRAVVVVLNNALDFLSVNLYDIIPYGAVWTRSIQTGNEIYQYIQPAGGAGIKGDTVYLTKSYLFFDTLTFVPTNFDRVMERMVMEGAALPSVSVAASTYDVYATAFADSSLYIYGASGDPDGQILINPGPVGEYDYQGNFIKKHYFVTPPQLGFDPTAQSVGARIGNRIYSGFVDEGFVGAPCASAVIDVRDLKFKRLYQVKVPDCGMAPSGTRCITVNGDAVYFLTLGAGNTLGLYKYDTTLQMIWNKLFTFDDKHYGVSLSAHPDGGVIMETCLNSPEKDLIRLYRIDPLGNVVSVVSMPASAETPFSVYPNPFNEHIHLRNETGTTASVCLYDQLGRLVSAERTDGDQVIVQTAHLPPGAYWLRMSDLKTGALLHQQWLIKSGQ